MEHFTRLPEMEIQGNGPISQTFLVLGISTFQQACRHVHQIPYGYNSDRDDLMILFKEKKGSCTTKHAVIATLARELGLSVGKSVGIYAMTEALVTGTAALLRAHQLPYVPMLHCFLASGGIRVDLTEGNANGKNGPIDDLLHAEAVVPNISAKEEYLLYRKALTDSILHRPELQGVDLKRILRAREEGLALLKAKVGN